jgi:hypothetical protein
MSYNKKGNTAETTWKKNLGKVCKGYSTYKE